MAENHATDRAGAGELRHEIAFVGMRAEATAVGFVQLVHELRKANVLDDAAIGRIKRVLADDLASARPRRQDKTRFEELIARRLEALFRFREEGAESGVILETIASGQDALGFGETDQGTADSASNRPS